MLEDMINKKLVKPSAVIGFWPANSVQDDIIIYKMILEKKFSINFLILGSKLTEKKI